MKRAISTVVVNPETGVIEGGLYVESPHHDARPDEHDVSLLVIHGISLPPGEFGNDYIEQLFLGKLNPHDHPYFESIYQHKVSAHVVIYRDGRLVQFVPFDRRAWHAGVSSFEGRGKCNDYAIGVELEGVDDGSYTDAQYTMLADLTLALKSAYPKITSDRIAGHSDIAPGRKTDPGRAFDWDRYYALIAGC